MLCITKQKYKILKFYGRIIYKKEEFYTKGFNTVEEAALAYNELARQYYKNRAFQNKIINEDIIIFED